MELEIQVFSQVEKASRGTEEGEGEREAKERDAANCGCSLTGLWGIQQEKSQSGWLKTSDVVIISFIFCSIVSYISNLLNIVFCCNSKTCIHI